MWTRLEFRAIPILKREDILLHHSKDDSGALFGADSLCDLLPGSLQKYVIPKRSTGMGLLRCW